MPNKTRPSHFHDIKVDRLGIAIRPEREGREWQVHALRAVRRSIS